MIEYADSLIVGGGVVGLTAALAMAQRGFSVIVLDGALPLAHEMDSFDSRVYAINQSSENLLIQLGVWQQLVRLRPYRKMQVWDALNNAQIEFDSRLIAAPSLGYIVEEKVLKEALLKIIKGQKNIVFYSQTKVDKLSVSDSGMVVGSDNTSWLTKLLMVSDGANSTCRQLLKIPLTSWSYHQEAIVALVHTREAHQETAYQRFDENGILAFLPMIDNHLCSIVWSIKNQRAKRLMQYSDDKFSEELTKVFAAKLGAVRVQGKRHSFALTMRHAKEYSGPHWLLLGDAAHTIHPLAGLGLNIGLADIATWIKMLNQSNNHINKKVLAAYQRERKHAVWQLILIVEGLKTLFNNPLSPIVALRSLGLNFCNVLPFVKKQFISYAAGEIE